MAGAEPAEVGAVEAAAFRRLGDRMDGQGLAFEQLAAGGVGRDGATGGQAGGGVREQGGEQAQAVSSDRRGLRTALLAFPRIRGLVAKARHGLGARAAAARGCDYRIEDALDTWLFADGAVAPLPPPAAAATGAVGHFADVLAGRTPLRPTPEQSLALQGIVDACYRSAGAGSILISPGEAEATP